MKSDEAPMVLLIDNYDSFVHNLARYLAELGCETEVVRSDAINFEDIRGREPQAIVLSPGPCTPRESGICPAVVRELGHEIPILGVCLGHQAIGDSLGARIVRAPEPMHGRTSFITHDGRTLFEGLPNPLTAMRYHSLMIDETTLPPELSVTARSTDGVIMAIEHRTWPVMGVQFHPESVLTQGGHLLLSNFLRLAGIDGQSPPNREFQHQSPQEDFYTREILRGHPDPGGLGNGD